MTVATLLLTCLIFLRRRLDGPGLLRHRALGRRHRLHRRLERRHHLAGPEDRASSSARRRATQQIAILIGALASALVLGPILLKLNDAATVYVPHATSMALTVARCTSTRTTLRRRSRSSRARRRASDPNATYRSSGTSTTTRAGPAGRYLVDDRPARRSTSSIPGINGTHHDAPRRHARSRSSTRPRRP